MGPCFSGGTLANGGKRAHHRRRAKKRGARRGSPIFIHSWRLSHSRLRPRAAGIRRFNRIKITVAVAQVKRGIVARGDIADRDAARNAGGDGAGGRNRPRRWSRLGRCADFPSRRWRVRCRPREFRREPDDNHQGKLRREGRRPPRGPSGGTGGRTGAFTGCHEDFLLYEDIALCFQ